MVAVLFLLVGLGNAAPLVPRCELAWLRTHYRDAKMVFSGQVLNMRSKGEFVEIRFKDLRSWKDARGPEILLNANPNNPETLNFIKSQRYLVVSLRRSIVKLSLRLIQVSVVLSIASISAWAQTSNDLTSKYGQAFTAFEIRPGIMMALRFDETGQASEMRIQHHAVTDSTIYLDTAIPANLANEIVDELVPVAKRGARVNAFAGLTLIKWGGGTSNDVYENVSITYYSCHTKECAGLLAIIIKWKNRTLNQ